MEGSQTKEVVSGSYRQLSPWSVQAVSKQGGPQVRTNEASIAARPRVSEQPRSPAGETHGLPRSTGGRAAASAPDTREEIASALFYFDQRHDPSRP